MAERITNFDDWKDLFYKWQKDIGFDAETSQGLQVRCDLR